MTDLVAGACPYRFRTSFMSLSRDIHPMVRELLYHLLLHVMLSHRLADGICCDQSYSILAESRFSLYDIRLVAVTYFNLLLNLLPVL